MARGLAERFPDYGIEAEVYVTAPGAEIEEGHPLVAAIDASHEEVFGAKPERDVTRWFSDASALTRAGIATVNYGTSTGLLDTTDGENLDIAGLVATARVYALAAMRVCGSVPIPMKLVTYDDGKAGRIDGEEIVRLDVPDMRTYFERGGADDARRAHAARRGASRSADHPEEVLPHRRQLPRARGGVEERRLGARDRALDRLLPERRRDRRPGRAGRLSGAPDRGARLRAGARRRAAQARKWFGPEDAADYIGGYVIFNDITARDIQRREMRSGVFSFCKAIDTFCPLGPWIVTPDEIPDPHDLAMTLRVNGEDRQVSHSSRMSVTIPEILSHYSALGYSAGRRALDRHGLGRRGVQPRRRLPVPEARRRDRGGDRADRRAAKPRGLVAGGARRAGAAARALVTWAQRRREARPSSGADGRAGARRPRRARARQRPLPDELLGHEGLRRLRLPARGRAGADLPRGVARRRGADGVAKRRATGARLRRERSAAGVRPYARPRRARSRSRSAASGSSSRSGRRPPTG